MVYFIREEGTSNVKIGKADCPKSRLSSLGSGNPRKLNIELLLDGSYELESELHKIFKHRRNRNEWFYIEEKVTQELIDSETRCSMVLSEISKKIEDKKKEKVMFAKKKKESVVADSKAINEKKLSVIDDCISFLQGIDSLTKITNKRISSLTGFKSDTLRRTLSVRQKRRIRSLNLDRYFSQEKVTQKFYVFLNNYEEMKGKSMSKLSKELKVSKDYVRVFIDIIEENSK